MVDSTRRTKLRIVNVQRSLQAQVFEFYDFEIMRFLVSLKLLKKGFGWSYRKQEKPILTPTLSLKEREQKKLKNQYRRKGFSLPTGKPVEP